MGSTRGEPNEIELTPTHGLLYRPPQVHLGQAVRVASRSISPQWGVNLILSGAIRFRLAPRAYDVPPWGARVVPDRPTKSRKTPTRKTFPPLSVARPNVLCPANPYHSPYMFHIIKYAPPEPFNSTTMAVNGGQFGFARSPARTPQ